MHFTYNEIRITDFEQPCGKLRDDMPQQMKFRNGAIL